MSKTANFLKSLYGRPSTVKTKKSLFDNHIKPYVAGNGAPIEMIHKACRGWVADELSLGSIKGCQVLLGEYMKFTYAYEIDKKRLSHQYFSGMSKPPEKLKVWNKEQAGLALITANKRDKELYAIMVVALGTGMRRGEIFGLKWGDVDFMDGYITVSHSLDISSGEIGPTKTNQSRKVQMSDRVAELLMTIYNVGDTGFVFKKFFDPNARLATIAKASSVPIITFHDLRHTCATLMFEANVPVKFISRMLGHAKLSTTLDIYIGCTASKQNLDNIYV